MKKWICFALAAALTLVSCDKTVIVEDAGWVSYLDYTNDLEVDCIISWKDPFNPEGAVSIRKLLPGGVYIQSKDSFDHGFCDEEGECHPVVGGKDLCITFGDGTCFTLDQSDRDFWKTLPKHRRTVKYRKDGTIRETREENFLSDIYALVLKPQED